MGLLRLHFTSTLFLVIVLSLFPQTHGELRFAYVKGRLFTNIVSNFKDRAEQTMYSLLQLLALNPPDVHGAIGNGVANDSPGAEGYAKIAFSRHPDDTDTILWPDYDIEGDAHAFIAPYEIKLRQLEKDMPIYEHRAPIVYWSGSFSGGGGNRQALHKCAEDNPDRAYVKLTNDWVSPVPDLSAVQAAGLSMKPIKFDLRQLLRYQFPVYVWGNGWSTSAKRILASGGTVLYPKPDRAESYFVHRVRTECDDCLTYYDARPPFEENLCASILNVTASLPKAVAKARAENLRRFVYSQFRHERMLADMRKILDGLEKVTYVPGMEHNETIEVEGVTLSRTTCQGHLKHHTEKVGGETRAWQFRQWYNEGSETCELRKDTNYLFVTAV